VSRLFISHSSLNDDWALALQAWLIREGWSGENDIFLDLDPERGIVAGQRWARALEDAATRCEAVLFLVSEVWLASKWWPHEGWHRPRDLRASAGCARSVLLAGALSWPRGA
jgi:TIR domain